MQHEECLGLSYGNAIMGQQFNCSKRKKILLIVLWQCKHGDWVYTTKSDSNKYGKKMA